MFSQFSESLLAVLAVLAVLEQGACRGQLLGFDANTRAFLAKFRSVGGKMRKMVRDAFAGSHGSEPGHQYSD